MTLFVARNLSMVLMLAAFPLISIGTMNDQPVVWWLGVASLAAGALLPPLFRYLPAKEPEPHEATDLGESSRVC